MIAKTSKLLSPMSETMLYMLFALMDERHGWGIMQRVAELTKGRIELGAGTIYQTLGKLEKAKLIESTREEERRKFYIITELGKAVLQEETRRIAEIYHNLEELL